VKCARHVSPLPASEDDAGPEVDALAGARAGGTHTYAEFTDADKCAM